MTHTATHHPPRAHTPRLGDDAIQERFAAGDEQALEECQSRFGSLLLANARRVVGANDAEDIVQTVMIEAWQKRHRYDPSRPLEVWLITILRRRAIDHLRKQKTVAVNLDTTGELSSEDGRETAQRFAVASDLRRALNELPNLQRETLILSYFGGMSQSEVASRIDAPLGTIKSRTSGGLQRLASLVGTSGLQ